MSGTTTAAASGADPGGLSRYLTPKWLITVLITTILVVGELRFSILGDLDRLLVALGVCMLSELALSWAREGRVRSVQSAYISGVSLTLLTKPQAGALWPFVLGSLLAIGSKYALAWRGRHLWNPTNFAISVLVLAAPGSLTILSHEFGNDLRVNLVIWTLGMVIVARAKLLHVTGTYVLAFAAFAGLRSLITDERWLIELLPITGPMYQLFLFFMITDPPTTVSTRRGRIVVAVAIAACESLLRLGNDWGLAWAAPFAPAPAIFALAMIGPVAKLIDLQRGTRLSPAAAR
jgi:Na+-translocating ferredoxin:NAD+ oxidoreductase RnfD subunit